MVNDAKHVSIETLKWHSSYEIEVETGTTHSPNINPIENVWWIIKKKFKEHELKNFDELKSCVECIYDDIPMSAIQN